MHINIHMISKIISYVVVVVYLVQSSAGTTVAVTEQRSVEVSDS